MTFKLDETPADFIAALYDAESTAPKNFRALLTQAAQRLRDYENICQHAADELEALAATRVSVMDSTSSTEEKARISRAIMLELTKRLRAVKDQAPSAPSAEVI
jgi:hypothetical protein